MLSSKAMTPEALLGGVAFARLVRVRIRMSEPIELPWLSIRIASRFLHCSHNAGSVYLGRHRSSTAIAIAEQIALE